MERTPLAGAVAYRMVEGGALFLVVTSLRDPLKWIFPKGHIEAGEEAAACAVRELEEEAGVVGRVVAVLETLSWRSRDEEVDVTFFLVEASGEGDDREGRQLLWLPLADAMRRLSHDDTRSLLERAAAALE